ncbi:predicted protein [Naegleria gruberi]|uniref:Predicted protein n=1 Tax=Naegleria gruberi TaxID=5762 RepID=D2VFV3_NAEGR|nr:uncharacterized protein NAEGRDRAFT_67755 [Naegleria gruberi]EFC44146.1 predicted protein [Naegleria gruberi]|eukprot:XP_002676890.1 predicted protein [Naegleria gruberi strain NEG-M]
MPENQSEQGENNSPLITWLKVVFPSGMNNNRSSTLEHYANSSQYASEHDEDHQQQEIIKSPTINSSLSLIWFSGLLLENDHHSMLVVESFTEMAKLIKSSSEDSSTICEEMYFGLSEEGKYFIHNNNNKNNKKIDTESNNTNTSLFVNPPPLMMKSSVNSSLLGKPTSSLETFIYLFSLCSLCNACSEEIFNNFNEIVQVVEYSLQDVNCQNDIYWQEIYNNISADSQSLIILGKFICAIFPHIQILNKSNSTILFGHICRCWTKQVVNNSSEELWKLLARFLSYPELSRYYFFTNSEIGHTTSVLLANYTIDILDKDHYCDDSNFTLSEKFELFLKVFKNKFLTSDFKESSEIYEYCKLFIDTDTFKEEHFELYLRFKAEMEYIVILSPPFVSYYRAIEYLLNLANQVEESKETLSENVYIFLKSQIILHKLKKASTFEISAEYYSQKDYLITTFKKELEDLVDIKNEYFTKGYLNPFIIHILSPGKLMRNWLLVNNKNTLSKIQHYSSLAGWYKERGNCVKHREYLQKAYSLFQYINMRDWMNNGIFEVAESLVSAYASESLPPFFSKKLLIELEALWSGLDSTRELYFPGAYKILINLKASLCPEKESREILDSAISLFKSALCLRKDNYAIEENPNYEQILKYGGEDNKKKDTSAYQVYISLIKDHANTYSKSAPKVSLKIYRNLLIENTVKHDHCSIRLFILSLFSSLNMQNDMIHLCDQLFEYYGTYPVVKIRCYQYLADYYKRKIKFSTLLSEELQLIEKSLLNLTGAVEVLKENDLDTYSSLSDFLLCAQTASSLYSSFSDRIKKDVKWESFEKSLSTIFEDLIEFLKKFDFSNCISKSNIDLVQSMFSILSGAMEFLSTSQLKTILLKALLLSENIKPIVNIYNNSTIMYGFYDILILSNKFFSQVEEPVVKEINYEKRDLLGSIFSVDEENTNFWNHMIEYPEDQFPTFLEIEYGFLNFLLEGFQHHGVYKSLIYKQIFDIHRRNKNCTKELFLKHLESWKEVAIDSDTRRHYPTHILDCELYENFTKFKTKGDLTLTRMNIITDVSSIDETTKQRVVRDLSNDIFFHEKFLQTVSMIQSYEMILAINLRQVDLFSKIPTSFCKLRALRSILFLESVTGINGLSEHFFERVQQIQVSDDLIVNIGCGNDDRIYIYAKIEGLDLNYDVITEDRVKVMEKLLESSFFGFMDIYSEIDYLSCGLSEDGSIYLHTYYELKTSSFSKLLYTLQTFIKNAENWKSEVFELISKKTKHTSATNIRERIFNTRYLATHNTKKKYGLSKDQGTLVESIITLIEKKEEESKTPTHEKQDENEMLEVFTDSTLEVLESYLSNSTQDLYDGTLQKYKAKEMIENSLNALCFISDLYHLGQLKSKERADNLLQNLGDALGLAGNLQFTESDRICTIAANGLNIYLQHRRKEGRLLDHIFIFAICSVKINCVHKKDQVYTYFLKSSLLGGNSMGGGFGVIKNENDPAKISIYYYTRLSVENASDTALMEVLPGFVTSYSELLDDLEKILSDRSC